MTRPGRSRLFRPFPADPPVATIPDLFYPALPRSPPASGHSALDLHVPLSEILTMKIRDSQTEIFTNFYGAYRVFRFHPPKAFGRPRVSFSLRPRFHLSHTRLLSLIETVPVVRIAVVFLRPAPDRSGWSQVVLMPLHLIGA
jgi:hypothetical protein